MSESFMDTFPFRGTTQGPNEVPPFGQYCINCSQRFCAITRALKSSGSLKIPATSRKPWPGSGLIGWLSRSKNPGLSRRSVTIFWKNIHKRKFSAFLRAETAPRYVGQHSSCTPTRWNQRRRICSGRCEANTSLCGPSRHARSCFGRIDLPRVERTSSRAGLAPAVDHHLSRRTR